MTRFNRVKGGRQVLLFLIAVLIVESESNGNVPSEEDISMFALPLEQVMDIEVISASRTQGQDVFSSPAAIYVITQEDIRRSGHRSLAELLRMVPGLYVARSDGNKWNVSSRGITERFYRMMLVQIDGRTAYSPMFAGVTWESFDVMLEDIERIEIIRGPGATLWGANAVNGIVNIITKNARNTQGGLLSGGAGTEERGFGAIRYGGKLDQNTFYRVYGKYSEQDKTATYGVAPWTDDRGIGQTGFRIDRKMEDDQTFTLQGDFYDARISDLSLSADVAGGDNPIEIYDSTNRGWNISGHWKKQLSDTSGVQFQIYYDRTQKHVPLSVSYWQENNGILDYDFQHDFCLVDGHKFVWGVGYRRHDMKTHNVEKLTYLPDNTTLHTYSGFIQDTIEVLPDLNVILGTKLELNDHTGFEYQPNARIIWTPNENHAVWSSISRAVRVPSLANYNGNFILTVLDTNMPYRIINNTRMQSEKILAYELGYRIRPADAFSLDIATFYHEYEDLESASQVDPVTLQWDNDQHGHAHGVEVAANWQLSTSWKLLTGYTWLKMDLSGGDESVEDNTPEHQFQVRSYLDITANLELNSALYFYDNVPAGGISDYTRLDVGLTWRPTNRLELSLWGQNLLDSQHPEYTPDIFFAGGGGEIQKGLYGAVKLLF
ncbi:MAG: TonB-dependent receptor [Sedimentisphaerales bacterium]|nr:TonB-dependent receptor [Sedimentisphaerales bacterium]